MQSKAQTVSDYLKSLPQERRRTLEAVRSVIKKNIDSAFEEGMQYGMISYYVPHSIYPAGYHAKPEQPLPFAALAAQKNSYSLYLMHIYGSEKEKTWFLGAWEKSGKKLDMGKSCVRFKQLEDLPLDVIGKSFKRVTAKQYVAGVKATLKKTDKSTKKR